FERVLDGEKILGKFLDRVLVRAGDVELALAADILDLGAGAQPRVLHCGGFGQRLFICVVRLAFASGTRIVAGWHAVVEDVVLGMVFWSGHRGNGREETIATGDMDAVADWDPPPFFQQETGAGTGAGTGTCLKRSLPAPSRGASSLRALVRSAAVTATRAGWRARCRRALRSSARAR